MEQFECQDLGRFVKVSVTSSAARAIHELYSQEDISLTQLVCVPRMVSDFEACASAPVRGRSVVHLLRCILSLASELVHPGTRIRKRQQAE